MDYQKIYSDLISSRKDRRLNEDGYYEIHHIIPKCRNGSNEKDNLIALTAREHYLAHWLLLKIYNDDYRLKFAFSCMSGILSPTGNREFTSAQYERCKIYNSLALKQMYKEHPERHPGRSENSREAARKRMKENNPQGSGANNTNAKKTEVVYMDGTVEIFQYAKEISEKRGIPYSSVKCAIKFKSPMKKYNIRKISYA